MTVTPRQGSLGSSSLRALESADSDLETVDDSADGSDPYMDRPPVVVNAPPPVAYRSLPYKEAGGVPTTWLRCIVSRPDGKEVTINNPEALIEFGIQSVKRGVELIFFPTLVHEDPELIRKRMQSILSIALARKPNLQVRFELNIKA